MIHTVRIRRFKRFGWVEFRLPGHVVLAGPNNTGKTTVLQAIASWALSLQRWREFGDFNRRRGYTYVPIARQAFTSVPLRSFDLLWLNRTYSRRQPIEIEVRHSDGWAVTMELIPDSTEQIYVRPTVDTPSETLRELEHRVAFIPPMSGIGTDEPVFQTPKIEQLLGLGARAKCCVIYSRRHIPIHSTWGFLGNRSKNPSVNSSGTSFFPLIRVAPTSGCNTESRIRITCHALSWTLLVPAADSNRC